MFDEPKDPFESVEPVEPTAAPSGGAPPAGLTAESIVKGPSAIEAGKLKPLSPTSPELAPAGPEEEYEVKASFFGSKIFIAIVVIIVLAAIGAVVWWFLVGGKNVSPAGKTSSSPVAPSATSAVGTPAPPAKTLEEILQGQAPGAQAAPPGSLPIASPPNETSVPASASAPASVVTPAPIAPTVSSAPTDADGDGLNNAEELALKTDPNNPDSDADGLTDGSEVKIWKTDPLNPDTDGDDFKDGQEVKAGYDPNAVGKKLFEVPAQ